ncbi:MAG: hypothetical protein AABW92_04315 [Nanoarchaeota archaeon]
MYLIGEMYILWSQVIGNIWILEQCLHGWELRFDYELAPSLLDGMADIYELNSSKQESLRLMIMNYETLEFIAETLNINENNLGPLLRFLYTVYEGPVYIHYLGPARRSDIYSLGFELTENKDFLFKYVHQEDQTLGGDDYEISARFSETDLNLMKSIAYGPLLQGNI